jgi:integrase
MGVGRRREKDKHLPRGVYQHHGAYWLRRYEGGRKRAIRLAATYPEALAQLSRILDGAAAHLTLAALIARYELEEMPRKALTSQKNERYRLPALAKVFGEMAPEEIEPQHVWQYWRERGEGGAARHEIRLLSCILTFGRRIGALSKPNPCYGLRLPGEKPRERYVTDEEFLAVRALAPTMVGYAMDLALMAGMDRSTILALERRHVTDAGLAFTRGKTKEQQVISWSPDLRQVIDAILHEPPRLRAALICTQHGKRYTADGFKTLWHRTMDAAVKAGIARFHFHDLRAKSASDADSDQSAADRLGHQSPALTRRVYRRLPRLAEPLKLPTPREK